MNAHDAYMAVFWPISIGVGMYAFLFEKTALLRCAFVVLAGQLAAIGYDVAVPRSEQPWLALLAIYAVSSFALTVRPSERICSVMAWPCIAGVLMSITKGAFSWSSQVDWAYWYFNLSLGWAMLAILAGGASGESGKRLYASVRRLPSKLADVASRGGLA